MAETDLILMTLVIFVPSIVALIILFLPRGWEENMRWTALFGTALTLGLSLAMFVRFYKDTIEKPGVQTEPGNGSLATLNYRADLIAQRGEAAPPPSDDWLARIPWIPRFNINYYVGTDGISMPLVLLTTILCFLAMIASWKIDRFVKGYCMLFLVLETGMIGTFLSLDFFLFYVFWEVMLLPMYFLIGIWGGPRREYAAVKFFLYTLLGSVFILIALLAFYFTDVHDFVSPQTLNAVAERTLREQEAQGAKLKPEQRQARLIKLRAEVPINTFDLLTLQRVGKAAQLSLNGQHATLPSMEYAEAEVQRARQARDAEARKPNGDVAAAEARVSEAEHYLIATEEASQARKQQWFFTPAFQYVMFIFLLIGFAIKVPMFPFHTWLPDAHVEAPTPISMILAGVLLKLGGYGIIRIAYPICPWAAEHLATLVASFAMINIVYGAFAAMAQTDFKKLVAYSSISHMGYVLLGIAVWASPATKQYWAWGMNGAMFQMIAHGITSAGMFFLVGVIYDRAHHRNLDNFRGLYEPMPLYGGISAVIFFAAMGLPGMCGFVGEFMVILSAWNFAPGGKPVGIVFAVLAALTVVITAAYILWTIQRVFFGQNPQYKSYADINLRELVPASILAVLSVLLGILPTLFLLSWMEPTVTALVDALAGVSMR